MTDTQHHNSLEQVLRTSPSEAQVDPELHRAVMQRVRTTDELPVATSLSAPRLTLVGAAAISIGITLGWLLPASPVEDVGPLADKSPAAAFSHLLAQRLNQPVTQLTQWQPDQQLESEWKALTADLNKLTPVWPWQPAKPPPG